jgi:hypothetical protein
MRSVMVVDLACSSKSSGCCAIAVRGFSLSKRHRGRSTTRHDVSISLGDITRLRACATSMLLAMTE